MERRSNVIVILERSPSSMYTFVRANQDAMDARDEFVLRRLGQAFQHCHQPEAMTVFLRTTPEVAMQRIKERARHGEDGITLSYLTRLNQLFESAAAEKAWKIVETADKTAAAVAEEVAQLIHQQKLICPHCRIVEQTRGRDGSGSR